LRRKGCDLLPADQPKMSATSIATALLVSDCAATVTIFAQCLSELAIATETCSHHDAVRLINRKKFEAVIIDSNVNGTGDSVPDAVRCSRSNRRAVTFAISEQTAQISTLTEGPTFILEAPLSRSAIDETLKKSFVMMGSFCSMSVEAESPLIPRFKASSG
jgi:hypothetical protein